MEDEVFEKYFKKLGEIYFLSYAYQYASFKEQDKKSVREILEEIYNEGVEKGTDMFLVELDR